MPPAGAMLDSFVAFKIGADGRMAMQSKIKDARDKLALVQMLEIAAQRLRNEAAKEIGYPLAIAA
ncbi:MAG: hypothetical protein D4R65_06045 [Verrucomicrobiaceae bacterium]|nr:MAG: hypothetical protein D4R65_06045 [Verrucomicrobiaceae bacterium]